MPELPEVETICCDLRKNGLIGPAIQTVSVTWNRSIATPSVSEFVRVLQGDQVEKISRRAKFIVMSLRSGFHLLIHLRMTGRINFFDPTSPKTKHDHVTFNLSDGRELRFTDTRKFGRLYLLKDIQTKFSKLGPEPLDKDFKIEPFQAKLNRHKRKLKPLLLDQSFIAGLGNIYVDEALFEARIHPERNSNTLKPKEVNALYRAIIDVLNRGVKNLGTSLGTADTNYYSVGGRRGRNQDALKVFRKHGQKCPRCKATISRIIVGQRSSHICKRCQKIKN